MNQTVQPYLIVPSGPGSVDRFGDLVEPFLPLGAASVLIVPADTNWLDEAAELPPLDRTAVDGLVKAAQSCDMAALVLDDGGLARDLGADGIHLRHTASFEERYASARAALGPDRIVGCSAGASRHDAMLLGEAGADYVSFSDPELVCWWAEIFEVPVVAFGCQTPEQIAAAVAARADFVAIEVADHQAPELAVALEHHTEKSPH